MIVFAAPRQSGKTHQLILRSHKKQLPIFCVNRQMVDYIQKQAIKMNLDIPKPQTHKYLIDRKFRGNHSDIIIDDVDHLLQYMFRGNIIDMISISTNDCPMFLSDENRH